MNREFRNITPEEVFYIFIEEHRLCSPLDCEADPTFELTMDSSIREWSDARDLLPWRKLSKYFNAEFEIQIAEEEWKNVFVPEKKKKLKGVCNLISRHAKTEIVKPIKLFGHNCLSASLFRTIKRNLSNRGVDTSELKPSSLVKPYLNNNFGEFVEQINKNYTGVIPDIECIESKVDKPDLLIWAIFTLSFVLGFIWKPIWILTMLLFLTKLFNGIFESEDIKVNKEVLYFPGIKTFRDLVEAIIEKKYATQQ